MGKYNGYKRNDNCYRAKGIEISNLSSLSACQKGFNAPG
jgi:hypothetical protein